MLRPLLWLLVCSSFLLACAVTQRLPADVATAVARDEMRLMRTQNIDLYYPVAFHQEATELAERAEGCLFELRRRTLGEGGLSKKRVEIIFADLPFNNAFVKPPLDGDFFSVIPTHFTFDSVTELGMPPAPSYIACHELAHYVQAQQTFRVFGGLNRAFGYFLTPQVGLDAWFLEGLATYYETRLQPGSGRPNWPVWQGMFEAAASGRKFRGGHLSPLNREIHWGNHYLYGSHFITYLIDTYGEEKLWRVVLRQGKSFFFPFVVNHRFKREYGKSLSTLLSEFDQHLAAKYPVRSRPATQHVIRDIGANGRYARAADGSEAVIREAMDEPTTLSLYRGDGSLEYQMRLTDVVPLHQLIAPSAGAVSGLSFSRDGRFVYFVMVDPGPVYQRARLMRFDRSTTTLSRVVNDLAGVGGDVSPDGRSYLFVAASGHGHTLMELDLATLAKRTLYQAPPNVYLTAPRYSPDGRTIVASVFDGVFALTLFETASGRRIETFSRDAQVVFDGSFLDDTHLLLLAEQDEHFQVFTLDLETRALTQLSHAPYVALHPRAARGTVRFFNREGLAYSLDEISLEGGKVLSQWSRTAFLADVDDANRSADLSTVPPASSGDLTSDVHPTSEPSVPTSPSVNRPTNEAGASEQTPVEAAVDRNATQPMPSPSIRVGAPSPLPPPPRLRLLRVEDTEESTFPRLLIPSLRVPLPFVVAIDQASQTPLALGFYLGGTDALGKHRWGMSGGVQPETWRLSGAIGYLNAQLAPLFWQFGLSQLDYENTLRSDDDEDNDGDVDKRDTRQERHRQRDAFLEARIYLRVTSLGLTAHITDDYQPDSLDLPVKKRTLGGLSFGVSHYAVEDTPMSGPRRGFAGSLLSSIYPDTWSSLDANLFDLRGSLTAYTPLPLSRRHTLNLDLRARKLFGDSGLDLLEVGGLGSATFWNRPTEADDVPLPGMPPKRRFNEALRGFETAGFNVSQIFIGDLTYRYPLIIDVGTATSFWIFPAFFLRQINFELFASGATASANNVRRNGHAAIGGAISASIVWLGLFELRYDIARRVTDDHALQHLLGIGGVL